jgi:heptosyltransferase-2
MKVLVVAPAWIGDMVMASCLLQRLAGSHPGSEIHVAAPAATAPLAERMPQVARVHVLPFAHGRLDLGARLRSGRRLARERFDWAIVLPNTWKAALVVAVAGIRRRTGYVGEARHLLLNDCRRLDAAALPRMVDRFHALGGEPEPAASWVPVLRADRARAGTLAADFALPAAPALALCPGAEYGPAKRWPPAHFAHVAQWHLRGGGQVWILGGRGDAAAAAAVRAALTPAERARTFDLTGRTRLLDAVDLLAVADSVVCNDSGLMHVAAALGRPVVGIFGSTTPAFTPPLGPRAQALTLGLSCSPCFARTCPLGHGNCLQALGADRVVDALRQA